MDKHSLAIFNLREENSKLYEVNAQLRARVEEVEGALRDIIDLQGYAGAVCGTCHTSIYHFDEAVALASAALNTLDGGG